MQKSLSLWFLLKRQVKYCFMCRKPVIEWIDIPAGTFIISTVKEAGRDENELQYKVTVNAFKMSKYEITFERYDHFCEADGREFSI